MERDQLEAEFAVRSSKSACVLKDLSEVSEYVIEKKENFRAIAVFQVTRRISSLCEIENS